MPKPPKLFPQPVQDLAQNQAQPNASLLGEPEEPSMPEWAVEILLSRTLKRRKMARVDQTAKELLLATRLLLRVERLLRNGPNRRSVPPRENLLAEVIESYLKSTHRGRIHSTPAIQVQATFLAPLLTPYDKIKYHVPRVLWITDNISEILAQMKKVHGCSSHCLARTNPPSDDERRNWAQWRGAGTLRMKILAYYHGLHEDTVRRIWN